MYTAAVKGYPQPFDDPRQWSPAFTDFLAHCLQVDPTARWNVDQLLSHPFLLQSATRETMVEIVKRILPPQSPEPVL